MSRAHATLSKGRPLCFDHGRALRERPNDQSGSIRCSWRARRMWGLTDRRRLRCCTRRSTPTRSSKRCARSHAPSAGLLTQPLYETEAVLVRPRRGAVCLCVLLNCNACSKCSNLLSGYSCEGPHARVIACPPSEYCGQDAHAKHTLKIQSVPHITICAAAGTSLLRCGTQVSWMLLSRMHTDAQV